MIDLEARVESAVEYLAKTDKTHAELKAKLNSLNELRKSVKAFEYIQAMESGVTQGRAEQEAYSSEKYKEHLGLISKAEIEFQTVQNRRVTAIQMIELYRTQSANQRRGNL